MSIQIWGDVTEEEYEHYKKHHSTVIIEGNIITKAEREERDRIEEEKRLKKHKKDQFVQWSMIIFMIIIIGSLFLL